MSVRTGRAWFADAGPVIPRFVVYVRAAVSAGTVEHLGVQTANQSTAAPHQGPSATPGRTFRQRPSDRPQHHRRARHAIVSSLSELHRAPLLPTRQMRVASSRSHS